MSAYWLIGIRIGIMLIRLCIVRPLLFIMRISGAWYLLGAYLVMKGISTKFDIIFPDFLVLIILVIIFIWIMSVRLIRRQKRSAEV